jgi:branched-chain amino acid transport system substrate-binding protein
MRRVILLVFGLCLAASTVFADDAVKIGMITTLSGGGSGLGIDIRDGFQLAVDEEGGTLGGVAIELIIEDDGRKPDKATEIADRMIKRDKVQVMTGIVWSNLAVAVVPKVVRKDVFYISPNAGPSLLAGKGCHENYFNVAWQNDNLHEAVGQYVKEKGFGNFSSCRAAWVSVSSNSTTRPGWPDRFHCSGPLSPLTREFWAPLERRRLA